MSQKLPSRYFNEVLGQSAIDQIFEHILNSPLPEHLVVTSAYRTVSLSVGVHFGEQLQWDLNQLLIFALGSFYPVCDLHVRHSI